jgi:hypothetical protein
MQFLVSRGHGHLVHPSGSESSVKVFSMESLTLLTYIKRFEELSQKVI